MVYEYAVYYGYMTDALFAYVCVLLALFTIFRLELLAFSSYNILYCRLLVYIIRINTFSQWYTFSSYAIGTISNDDDTPPGRHDLGLFIYYDH